MKKNKYPQINLASEETNIFKKEMGVLWGNVHTVSLFLPDYRYSDEWDNIITTYGTISKEKVVVRRGSVGTTLHFNPNKKAKGGGTLRDYYCTLTGVLANMHYSGEYTLNRLDFRVDCNPPEELKAYWVKLNSLLVYCFMAYKRIDAKGRDKDTDPITDEFKQVKGSTRGIEIALYNKRIQAPEEDVDYRTELRALRLNSMRDRPYCDEAMALNRLKKTIAALPRYYEQAVNAQLTKLIHQFHSSMPTDRKRSISEFLRAHQGSLFTKSQIMAFARECGSFENEAKIKKFAENFLCLNPTVFMVKQSELIKLCATIIDLIDTFVASTQDAE